MTDDRGFDMQDGHDLPDDVFDDTLDDMLHQSLDESLDATPGDSLAGTLDGARMEQLLHGLAPHYRVPPPAPLEAMWARVEAEHFGRPGLRVVPGDAGRRLLRRWGGPLAGLAAGLLIGVGFGTRLGGGGDAGLLPAADQVAQRVVDVARDGAPQVDPAYREVATDYFDQTAALLVTLPAQLDEGRAGAQVVRQASELLSTTRLLLDSPALGDPELQSLLDDLELILAQIVRLPAVGQAEQAALIADALEARHVLPRLRSAAALSSPLPPLSHGAD